MVYDTKFADRNGLDTTEDTRNSPEWWGLPKMARLEIELSDPLWYRSTADILRTLASRLDLLSRKDDRATRYAIFEAYQEIKSANVQMKKPTRSGGSTC